MGTRRIDTIKGPNGEVDVIYDSVNAEFVCKLRGKPVADYYTDDRDDAIGTAKLMAGQEPDIRYQ